MSWKRHRLSAIAVVLLVAPAVGCGGLVRDVARDATPGVVEGVVESATNRDTQEKIVDGVDPKMVRAMTRKLVDGVVDGTLDALEDPARLAKLRRDFVEVTRGFELPMRIDHVDSRSIGDALDESIHRLGSPENMAKLGSGVSAIVREAVRSAFAQGREEMAEADVGASTSVMARDFAKQATLGFQDAIDETAERKREGTLPSDEGNVLDGAARAAKSGTVWLPVAIGAFVAFGLVLIGAVIWAGRRVRAARADLDTRDRALEALVEVLAATDDQPWSRELRRILSDTLGDRENVDHLRRLIRSKRDRAPASP